MKIAGIILLALQAAGLFGGMISGELATMLTLRNIADMYSLVGFFSPAIVGVILLVIGLKKEGQ